jgi:hypothetical protein
MCEGHVRLIADRHAPSQSKTVVIDSRRNAAPGARLSTRAGVRPTSPEPHDKSRPTHKQNERKKA